jgi:hypothetical protein
MFSLYVCWPNLAAEDVASGDGRRHRLDNLLRKENILQGYPYPNGTVDTTSAEQSGLCVGAEIFRSRAKESHEDTVERRFSADI